MNLLKKQLTTALALKLINYYENAGDIVFVIDVSSYRWGTVLMQYTVELNQKQYSIRYKSEV